MSVGTFPTIDLACDGEVAAFAASERNNLSIGSRFLCTKIIARDCQNLQTCRRVLIIQRRQLGVILACQASFRCDVDDQVAFLASILAQAGNGGIRSRQIKVKERSHLVS